MNETSIAAADSVAVSTREPRDQRIQLAAGVLAVLALVAALYLARGFFVPLLIGILASYALHPLVDWLAAHRELSQRVQKQLAARRRIRDSSEDTQGEVELLRAELERVYEEMERMLGWPDRD